MKKTWFLGNFKNGKRDEGTILILGLTLLFGLLMILSTFYFLVHVEYKQATVQLEEYSKD